MGRELSGWTAGVMVIAGVFASIALSAAPAGAQEARGQLPEIREGRRDVRQDPGENRHDGRELRGDRQELRHAMRSNAHAAIRKAWHERRADRREARRHIHDRHGDARDLPHDWHQYRRDHWAGRAG